MIEPNVIRMVMGNCKNICFNKSISYINLAFELLIPKLCKIIVNRNYLHCNNTYFIRLFLLHSYKVFL